MAEVSAALFSFVKIYDGSVVASVRIARFLRDLLELPLYEKGTTVPEDLDVLLIVNGAYAFAGGDTLAMLGRAIDTARRVVWIQQDYTIIPPKDEGGAESPFRKAFRSRHDRGAAPVDYWTTCEPYSRQGRASTGHICGPGSRYVNWNALTFDPDVERVSFDKRQCMDEMIYYGSYRVISSGNKKDRSPYFRRYLASPKVKMVISCPTNKFVEAGYVGPKIRHTDKIDVLRDLRHFGLGLYLEDQMSDREFHSPANRFYEMLSAGLGMVFQPEAMRMMERAEIDVSDFVLWNADEAPAMMERADIIADQQRALWWSKARDARSMLSTDVVNLWDYYKEKL